jgi:hypothetical protein
MMTTKVVVVVVVVVVYLSRWLSFINRSCILILWKIKKKNPSNFGFFFISQILKLDDQYTTCPVTSLFYPTWQLPVDFWTAQQQ